MSAIMETLSQVERALRILGHPANLEYPGFISVVSVGGEWAFGVANPLWGGHKVTESGDVVEGTHVEFPIPSDSTDAWAIAAHIARAIR